MVSKSQERWRGVLVYTSRFPTALGRGLVVCSSLSVQFLPSLTCFPAGPLGSFFSLVFGFFSSLNPLLTQLSRKIACMLVVFSFSPWEGWVVLQQWLQPVLGGGLGFLLLQVLSLLFPSNLFSLHSQGRWARSCLI